MSFETNKNIETTELTNEAITKEIKDNINKLSKIDPKNELITKLENALDKFITNKDALLIIFEGLKKINNQVSLIANKGQEDISSITGQLFKELEKLDSSDFNLDKEISNL